MKRKIATTVLLVLCGFLWWYVWVLLKRTDFLEHGTNLANGTIHLVYLACLVAMVLALYVAGRGLARPLLDLALVAAALAPTATFAWLNLSETICMSKKAGECIPLFSKDYPLVSLFYPDSE